VPNLRAQAACDLKSIIEDTDGAGTPYTLIDDAGEYPVAGTFGDIGSLIDPMSGEPIQGRAIEVTVAAQSIIDASGVIPQRGWRVKAQGLDGKEIMLYVQRN
jgi:hypothetical protein